METKTAIREWEAQKLTWPSAKPPGTETDINDLPRDLIKSADEPTPIGNEQGTLTGNI